MDLYDLRLSLIDQFNNMEYNGRWFVDTETIEVSYVRVTNPLLSLEVRYVINQVSEVYVVKGFSWYLSDVGKMDDISVQDIVDYIANVIETYAKPWNTPSFKNIFVGR